jgi:hypothetical protein
VIGRVIALASTLSLHALPMTKAVLATPMNTASFSVMALPPSDIGIRSKPRTPSKPLGAKAPSAVMRIMSIAPPPPP